MTSDTSARRHRTGGRVMRTNAQRQGPSTAAEDRTGLDSTTLRRPARTMRARVRRWCPPRARASRPRRTKGQDAMVPTTTKVRRDDEGTR